MECGIDGFFGEGWGGEDETQNIASAVGFIDEATSFYELSHPLFSEDEDDIAVEAFDVLGICVSYDDAEIIIDAFDDFPTGCFSSEFGQDLYQGIEIAPDDPV